MIVQCELCPKACLVRPGQSGECRVRVNLDGKLLATTYGYPCAVHVDPIEKKPLFHFLPGTSAFSIATVGCNLHCKNCQNWEISQANPENVEAHSLPPADLARAARQYGCRSIAYTYTDPVVYYEYTLDGARRAREAGLRNVLVTAGYINREPLARLCSAVDATQTDVKAFSDSFYREICGATLKPVLDGLVLCKERGLWVEVSNLVIPTLNDKDEDFRGLCRWLVGNLGRDTPLHFLGFFPRYRMKSLPPTPGATLQRAREIARAEGLHFVYIGNVTVPDAGNTFCPACGTLLIERRGFAIVANRVVDGRCVRCGGAIAGVWS